MILPHPRSTLFPYTTFFRSPEVDFARNAVALLQAGQKPTGGYSIHVVRLEENEDQIYVWYRVDAPKAGAVVTQMITHPDRKSTRLNSSHSSISYAVFCLKKK